MGSFLPKLKPSRNLSGLFDYNELDIYYHLSYHQQTSSSQIRGLISNDQIHKNENNQKEKNSNPQANTQKKKQINLTKDNFHQENSYKFNNSTHHQKKDRAKKENFPVMSIVVDPKNNNLNEKKKAEINTQDLLRTIDNTLEEDEKQNRFEILNYNDEESIDETSQETSIYKHTASVLYSTEEEIDLMSGVLFTSENESENGIESFEKKNSNPNFSDKKKSFEEHTKKSDSNLGFGSDSDSNSEKISSSKSHILKIHTNDNGSFRYDSNKHKNAFSKSDLNKRHFSTRIQQQEENQNNERATSFFNSDQQAWEDELDTDEEISFSIDNVERRQPIDYNEFISQEEESEMFVKEDLNENEVLEIFSE
ncbi:hypothetical protein M0813_20365 [Anaeramoeba flamelloides]|uniref:Uncharacterized protein n=1 Tax=Anaeramoeba flamelloides TaxID=1746091 RepID=A0ABQ8YLJ2_9EUKA|nr:hypothetical protein M0813_20365 [Anaeramoeba flamelloides]